MAKPAGLRVSGSDSRGGAGLEVIRALHDQPTLHVVQPLEDHVSGVLVLAKSEAAARRLGALLRSARATIEYLAILSGEPKPVPAGRGGRRSGGGRGVALQLVRRRKDLSLVRFSHGAVRTSAIRAELAGAGLPVLGDVTRKRAEERAKARPRSRLFLHRASVAFKHPDTGRAVSARAEPPRVFQTVMTASEPLEDLLEVALMSRLGCLLQPETDSLRLFTGRAEGVPGLAAEKLGPVIVLQTHQGKFQGDEDRVRRIARWYAGTFRARAVYHKRFVRDRSRSEPDDPELASAEPLIGRACPEEFPILENGLRFLVRAYGGYSTGLFLDQRENRRRVRELSAGGRVLNAFAYTCGFSVAAAAGGAAETVSVDVSRGALEWGRRNFAANGMSAEDQVFVRSDVFDYLKRAGRQGRSFELIVLDAPTFARSKRPARVFSIVKDLGRLIEESLGVLSPGGHVLVSTNNRTRSATWLREQVTVAAAAARRRFRVVAAPGLPADFAADPGYSRSLLVHFP